MRMPCRFGLVVFVPAFCLLFSCRLFNQAQVTVISWSPENELVEASSACTVSLTFSSPMNEAVAEEAFSLITEGEKAAGRFQWEGSVMTFLPDAGLSALNVYEMTLSTSAEDVYGNDLGKAFYHRFYFSEDRDRPAIISMTPGEGERVSDDHVPLVLTFSEALNRQSLYEAFSLNPDTPGSFFWDEGDRVCRFVPSQAFVSSTEYVVAVSSVLKDLSGNSMGDDFRSAFIMGTDDVAPSVLSAGNTDHTFYLAEDEPSDGSMLINEGWEGFWNFRIELSEPVPANSLNRYISLKPASLFDLNTGGGLTLTVFDILLEEPLAFDCLYTLTLLKGLPDTGGNGLAQDLVYHVRTDGPQSVPPAVSRVGFLEDPDAGSPATVFLSSFDNLNLVNYSPHTGDTVGFFDFYLILAAGAEPDLPSFMENFSITVENGCAVLNPVALEWGSYTGLQPSPASYETAVRMWVVIEDDPAAGLIVLKLTAKFKDSLGNGMPGDWLFILNEATS